MVLNLNEWPEAQVSWLPRDLMSVITTIKKINCELSKLLSEVKDTSQNENAFIHVSYIFHVWKLNNGVIQTRNCTMTHATVNLNGITNTLLHLLNYINDSFQNIAILKISYSFVK